MVNYQNGKIYVLRSYQTDDVYIGSTTKRLCDRKSGHRVFYKRWINGKSRIYIASFKLSQFDDMYIELVENFPCNSKEELLKREGEVIRATPNCVNINIAGRTDKEYYQDNKEQLKAKNKVASTVVVRVKKLPVPEEPKIVAEPPLSRASQLPQGEAPAVYKVRGISARRTANTVSTVANPHFCKPAVLLLPAKNRLIAPPKTPSTA